MWPGPAVTPGSTSASGPRVPAGDGPFQPGQQVGPRYTIIRLLGAGGMGAVYQAFDHELGVAVAIKVIRPAAGGSAATARELEQRFKRELVLARQVTHKHVVRIHDLGEIGGIKYLPMPFVEGETLFDVLERDGALPVPRALKIAKQVAQGLGAAHEKGVVHRDLKPENIMIESPSAALSATGGEGGDALIMDFGIARSVEHGGTQTAVGAVIGTLEYMAPEQAHGQKVDQRTDQYAFGLILYDMLTGRRRLTTTENKMSELLGRLQQLPPSPRSIKAEIPEALDQLVMRCLQASPDARFQTTADLVRALETLTPDGHLRASEAPASAAVAAPVVAGPRWPLWQLAVAALVLVALAGGGGWLLSRRAAPPAGPAEREPVSLLVADFENKTGDPVFDGVVEQALGLGVEGASFVTTLSRANALRAAASGKLGDRLDEKTARLVALREGVSLVLAGSVEPRDSAYRIVVRVVRPDAEGAPLHEVEAEAGGKAAILETVGSLAGKVRTALGDTAVAGAGPGANETFTAASLEAARAYAKAQEMQAAGKREDAIGFYKEAIRLDPDMGRAYSGIAAQFANLGRTADAEAYYKEALARIDRMTEREKYRTRGAYYLMNRKAQEAIKEFTDLLKAFPADDAAPGNLALAWFYARNMEQALEQGRKAAATSRNIGPRANLALYAMYAGQFDSAITASDDVLKLNPAYAKAFVARALAELALGRPADAVKTYEKLKGISAVGASFAASGLADVALYEGRTKDALALLTAGLVADALEKNTTGAALKHVALADAYLARGDSAAAAREATAAVAASPPDGVMLTAGLALARAGRSADALKVADTLSNELEPDPQAYGRLVRAEVALAQNQARAALDHAREGQKLADTWIGRVALARTYIALEQFTEATSELDAAVKRQGEATAVGLDDWPTFRYYPQVYYYRGLAQGGLKSPGASESFAAFVKIKEAGDEASGALADARKRLGR
jgi:tetratricopeptide (TPR) repeat protein